MNDHRKITSRKATYFAAVEDALAHLEETDREAILSDVEDHVDAALHEGGHQPTLARLEQILAELGTPESYALDAAARAQPPGPLVPRLSSLAAAGFLWSMGAIVFAFPAMFFVRIVDPNEPPQLSTADLVLRTLAWAGLAGVIGGPFVSSIALTRIRASAGRLHGVGLAVAGVWLVPLAIVDILVLGIMSWILDALFTNDTSLAPALTLLTFLLLLAWNVHFVRKTRERHIVEMQSSLRITPQRTMPC